MQNSKNKEAYQLLQKMILNKHINRSVLRSIRVRLEVVLAEKEKSFNYWKDNNSHKLNVTRQKEIRRNFERSIQAMKIVIYDLTPFEERCDLPPPTIIIKKNDKPKI